MAAGHRRVMRLNVDDQVAGTRAIAIVGAGPRGLSVLERLCANQPRLLAESALDIHVIDPWPPGPAGCGAATSPVTC